MNTVVNRDVNPLLAPLPSKIVSFKPGQVRAVLEILAALADVDVCVLDAPTGSGKTVIAEAVRLLRGWRGLYVCHSLGLQDQFAGDFWYGKVVKGRANYETQSGKGTCDDCEWSQSHPNCGLCESKGACPYERAKGAALRADLAVLNSTYALTEWNGPGRFSGRELVVVDEADTFEATVQGWISVYVSRRRMQRFGWEPPAKVTVASCWVDWLDEHIPDLERRESDEGDEAERKRLGRLAGQMRKVRKGLDDGLPYAYTGYSGTVEFKPVVVGDYCEEAVWKHGTKWLLMSATVISSSIMLRGLGWSGRHRTVAMSSSFAPGNRTFRVNPVSNMSRRVRDDEAMARAVHGEVEREPGRVVVHTVSYDLAGVVSRHLRGSTQRNVCSYRVASERASAISEYKRVDGSILVAPSADRGIDLPDDLCRLIVIAKVPFPNLGDRMVSTRLYGTGKDGQTWYTVETVRTVVQMAGRGVRHEDDWCKTVVLDSQFSESLWSKGSWLFPKWFREAMVWERKNGQSVGRNIR